MKEGTIQQSKRDLRRTAQDRLRTTTGKDRARWSEMIMEQLTGTESWTASAGAVAIFGGMKYEPELLGLLPWLTDRGFVVALFGIEGETMTPYRVHGVEDLVVGPFGVLEPRQTPEAALGVADLGTVLVPGLAFGTSDGSRLGRGKGHYDRILGHPEFRGSPMGVAFHLQFQPFVPSEAHDICLPRLLSEQGWWSPQAGC